MIEDNAPNIAAIVERAHASGASYIIPSFGMTMRDRQRAYYYEQLDRLFPGLRVRYERRFGERYHCPADKADWLAQLFAEECERYGIARRIEPYTPRPVERAKRAAPEGPKQLPLL